MNCTSQPEVEIPSNSINDTPIFVFGCAWRCGSTLLQRLLTSTGEILIWGEHVGLVHELVKIAIKLESNQHLSERQSSNFMDRGAKVWIANLNPKHENIKSFAIQIFLSNYYAKATHELGYKRWGFKEVRYDAQVAISLLEAFPNSKAIFLVRDLNGVLSSNAANDWYDSVGGAKGVTSRWIKNIRTFLSVQDKRVLTVSYSKIAKGDPTTFDAISSHVGLSTPIDVSLLSTKVRAADSPPVIRDQEARILNRKDVISMHQRLLRLGLIDNDL